MVMIKNRTRSW